MNIYIELVFNEYLLLLLFTLKQFTYISSTQTYIIVAIYLLFYSITRKRRYEINIQWFFLYHYYSCYWYFSSMESRNTVCFDSYFSWIFFTVYFWIGWNLNRFDLETAFTVFYSTDSLDGLRLKLRHPPNIKLPYSQCSINLKPF